MYSLLGISLHVNRSVYAGITNLACYLVGRDYPDRIIHRCLDYVAHEGTTGGLADLGLINPSDETAVEEAYVEGMEPVPAASHRWLDEGIWTDVESYDDALE